jgi:hypothetical protein
MFEPTFTREVLNDFLENVHYNKEKKGGKEGPPVISLSWFESRALG